MFASYVDLDGFEDLLVIDRGDLIFEEVGKSWGFDSMAISHAMALADLDNDGALSTSPSIV